MYQPVSAPVMPALRTARLSAGTWVVLVIVVVLVAACVAAGVVFWAVQYGPGEAAPPEPAPMPVVPVPDTPEAYDPGLPGWYTDPPSEPGVAIYAVALVDHVQNLALAKMAVEARAREQVVRALLTRIPAVYTAYLLSNRQGGRVPPELQGRIQRAARQVLDDGLSGVLIIKRAFGNQRPDGSRPAFALAKLPWEPVVLKMARVARENFELAKNSTEAEVAVLLRLLILDQEKKTPNGGLKPEPPR